jgi:release factor glutamine methyltransferase
MLRATKESPENHSPDLADRLSHAKNFANELSNSRLRETRERWTEEKRAEKAVLIRLHTPWARSSGPKTRRGKAKSAQNALRHGHHGQEWKRFYALLAAQRWFVQATVLRRQNDFPADPLVVQHRMAKLDEVLRRMRAALERARVETPALDARILARQGGNFSDADLITGGQTPLSEQIIENIDKLLERRLAGEPVSRIVGEREFWGLTFKVTPATLDPRADTETLVAAALKRAREIGAKPLRILDLGTGTGCIPIALLKELPNATAVAVDISADALSVSRENAARHGVADRLEFRQGSWFEAVNQGEIFDLITSNPPYIPESDIESLSKEVRNHDPIQALSGGADGLEAYKSILKDLKNHLECDGFALFEIGAGQEKDLARLIEDSNMTRSESYADLGGILRVVEIAMGTSENIFDGPR